MPLTIAVVGIVADVRVSPCLRMSSTFGMTLGGRVGDSASVLASIPVAVPAESVDASERYFIELVRLDDDGSSSGISSLLGRRRSWMTSELPSLPPLPVMATPT